jgi:membrane-bound lytic murein transglycosylase D
MRRLLLALLLLLVAALPAAAQTAPRRRPPPDTARARPAADSIRQAERAGDRRADADEAEEDSVPRKPGPYARSGGTGPFTVQASGEVAARPARGAVVWLEGRRPAAADSSRRDTARAGGQRVAAGQTRRDSASTTRPAPRDTAGARRDTTRAGGQRVAAGQTARRDSASASRPGPRDTARIGGQRVAAGQTTRRDTASSSSRPASGTGRPGSSTTTTGRPAGSTTTTTGRPAGSTTTTSTTGRTGSTGSTSGSTARPRTHTVASGETFLGIARRYGVTSAQLRALNPEVDINSIEVGDVLRLPASARDSRASAGTQRTGTQGTQRTQPAAQRRTHTVAAGETLYGIARRYGVTVASIREANEMESDQVRTGQRLVIPPAR